MEKLARRTARGAAEDVIGEGRYFQQRVDGGKEGDEEHRKSLPELEGRNGALWLKVHDSEDQIGDDVDHRRGNHLVEGVLDKAPKPAPEKPVHPGNDKKGNKNRPHKHAHRRGDESIGDDHDADGLRCRKQDDDDGVDDGSEDVGHAWRIHSDFEIGDPLFHRLELSLVDLVGQKLGLVGDQVMETGSYAGNRVAVVVGHSKAKADGQKKRGKTIELKKGFAAGRGESGLHAMPNHKNRGEGTEQVLSHGIEESEILGEQVVDGPKDELEIVHADLSFDAAR